MLFHTFVELFSIVVAFAVFIVTWNSRYMQDNRFLHLVGISYLFIGALDLLHTLSYKGMTTISTHGFPANQFWVATRFLEAATLLIGCLILKGRKRLNADLIFLIFFICSTLIALSILYWNIFPVCYIDGVGQTDFKIYTEYLVIAILLASTYLLNKNRNHFSPIVYKLLLVSMIFTILSEICFSLYISNYSTANELGHYAKLIAFFMIYKANVETGFISPTKSIFKNLKENEEKYRTLAENIPGLILRFDASINCIYSNTPIADYTVLTDHHNASPARSESQPLDKILTALVEHAHATSHAQQRSFEVEISGKHQFLSVQVIPENLVNPIDSTYLVIAQDVTALKQTEHQLHALNETKDKLFSIIAHDLKNPFTSLLTFSELIFKNAGKMDSSKIEYMAARMNESAKQAYTLLENLLNWSSVQTGTLKPKFETVSVDEIFAEARRLSNSSASAKDINLILENSHGKNVTADKQMLATVMRNLVSNAIKFSFPQSNIVIKSIAQGDDIIFSIADTGTGIAEEHRNQLLEIGNRFSAPGTAAEQGTGLGLLLCREFIELNNGKIWLESEFGIGTTFYFSLPSAPSF